VHLRNVRLSTFLNSGDPVRRVASRLLELIHPRAADHVRIAESPPLIA